MMEQKMDFQTFRKPLGEWAEKLKPFIESKEAYEIYQKIKADAQHSRKMEPYRKPEYPFIVPRSKETFRAFEACRPGDLKVIFYLQDPYPRLYKNDEPQACGIAMDCRNSPDGKLQPSLQFWYDAIDRYMGSKDYKLPDGIKRMDDPPKCERSPNLDYLHEQGVMLLNTDLTCKVGKTASHEGLWRPFQKYFLEEVMYGTTGIIYVLCGISSRVLKEHINPLGNYIFEIEHPFAAGHRGDDIWRDDNIFAKINKILEDNNGKHYKIWWDKQDWDFYKNPPF